MPAGEGQTAMALKLFLGFMALVGVKEVINKAKRFIIKTVIKKAKVLKDVVVSGSASSGDTVEYNYLACKIPQSGIGSKNDGGGYSNDGVAKVKLRMTDEDDQDRQP